MNTSREFSIGLILLLTLVIGRVVSAQSASFQGLGTLPDTSNCAVRAISANGTTVVGVASHNGCAFSDCPEAFQWTAASGMTGLGYPPGNDSSQAFDVSADGSIIVGGGRPLEGDFAWRWTQATGFVQLPTPNNTDLSFAFGVSGDGQVIVGHAVKIGQICNPDTFGYNFDVAACRWDAGGDDLNTPNPLPSYTESHAGFVSGDGLTVLGNSSNSNCTSSEYASCLWIGSGPAVPWSDYLSNGFTTGGPAAASHDGGVIVGSGVIGGLARAFRWTAAEGMVNLGVIAGGWAHSFARAVSADGSVVVGECSGFIPPGDGAYIWDQKHGMRALRSTLVEQGADPGAWTLIEAVDISADGLIIVGNGINPSGNQEAWIAVLGNPSPCATDLSADSNVGPADLAALLAAWGPCTCPADFDASGAAGPEDLAALLAAWGKCP